eukprot:UN04145
MFDGEEDAVTGKLFSPCKCKGSVGYVHVNCLNRWRQLASSKNYYSCPNAIRP